MSDDACTERLLELAYGELSGRDARRVEAHVAGCEACRAELERFRETRALMSGLGHEEAPARGERTLLAAAREAAGARRPRRRRVSWFLSLTAAAAALVAVGAVSYRILAMRPGPLERSDGEALLGGPYAAAPPPEARQEALPPGARAPEVPATEGAEAEPEAERPRPKAAPAEAARAPARRRAERPDAGGPAPHATPPPEPAPLGAPAPAGADRHAAAAADARAAGTAADDGRAPAASAAGPEAAPPPKPSPPAPDPAARAERAAPSAPAQAAPRAPSRAASKSAAPASPPASETAEAGALRREDEGPGGVTVEVRTFAGCEGEATRRVERDAQGRIVRYVRAGTIAGRRLVVEHVYGEDGALARATARDLDRPGAALDPAALGLALVTRAADAHADAPPRCGR